MFGFLVLVVSGLVTFLGALGTGVLPAVTAAAGLLIGREWSELARGKKYADDAWNRRNAHRK